MIRTLIELPATRRGVYRKNNLTDDAKTSSFWAWAAGFSAILFIAAIVYGVTPREAQTAFDRNASRPTTSYSSGVPATTGFGNMETTGASSGVGVRNPPQSGN